MHLAVKTLGWTLLLAAVAFTGAAGAANGSGEAPEIETLEAFLEQRARIEEEMRPGGAYMEISNSNRRSVVDGLGVIETELQRVGTVDAMSPDARVRVFNEQEKINEILTEAARDSRLHCERRGRVGTRFKQTHCATYAERMRRAEQDRDSAHRMMRVRLPDSN